MSTDCCGWPVPVTWIGGRGQCLWIGSQGWWFLFLRRGSGSRFSKVPERRRIWSRVKPHIMEGFPARCGLVLSVQSLCDLSKSLVHIDRFSSSNQELQRVRFGNHMIVTLLFADDVLMSASSSQDLQWSWVLDSDPRSHQDDWVYS